MGRHSVLIMSKRHLASEQTNVDVNDDLQAGARQQRQEWKEQTTLDKWKERPATRTAKYEIKVVGDRYWAILVTNGRN